jgi:hypothetical protein
MMEEFRFNSSQSEEIFHVFIVSGSDLGLIRLPIQ